MIDILLKYILWYETIWMPKLILTKIYRFSPFATITKKSAPIAHRLKTLCITLTEKGRLSGASWSEQMFEDISIISNHFRTFVWAPHTVNMQFCDCKQILCRCYTFWVMMCRMLSIWNLPCAARSPLFSEWNCKGIKFIIRIYTNIKCEILVIWCPFSEDKETREVLWNAER